MNLQKDTNTHSTARGEANLVQKRKVRPEPQNPRDGADLSIYVPQQDHGYMVCFSYVPSFTGTHSAYPKKDDQVELT